MLFRCIRQFSTSAVRLQQQPQKDRAAVNTILELLKQNGSGGDKASNTLGEQYSRIGQRQPPSSRQPRDLLSSHQLQKETNSVRKIAVPRTGVLAGRTVKVENHTQLAPALAKLTRANITNKVPRTISLQRYHERPGKVKRRLRLEKQKREFDMGVKRLFKLVNEARRKGY